VFSSSFKNKNNTALHFHFQICIVLYFISILHSIHSVHFQFSGSYLHHCSNTQHCTSHLITYTYKTYCALISHCLPTTTLYFHPISTINKLHCHKYICSLPFSPSASAIHQLQSSPIYNIYKTRSHCFKLLLTTSVPTLSSSTYHNHTTKTATT